MGGIYILMKKKTAQNYRKASIVEATTKQKEGRRD